MYISETAGDHLPMLKLIFRAYGDGIFDVLEFGSGLVSTPFFLSRGCKVYSIEMQSEEWYDKVQAELGHFKTLTHIKAIGAFEWGEYFDIPFSITDFAFVDGHADSRPECINACFYNDIPIIATHDIEDPYYRWDKVVKPRSYHEVIYKVKPNRHACFWINESLI